MGQNGYKDRFHRFGWREELFAIRAAEYPGDMLMQNLLERAVLANEWQLGDPPPAWVEMWTEVLDAKGSTLTEAEFLAKLHRQAELLRECLAIEEELQAAFNAIPDPRG